MPTFRHYASGARARYDEPAARVATESPPHIGGHRYPTRACLMGAFVRCDAVAPPVSTCVSGPPRVLSMGLRPNGMCEYAQCG